MHIAIVGTGYVGLVTAACFAELGHHVICVDNDAAKLAALQRGEVPIHEKFLPELLDRHRAERLTFAASLPQAVRAASVIFIAVGTPPAENGDADLSHLESVAREIARAIDGKYRLIVEKSTVPVYTSDCIHRAMVHNCAPARSFDVACNPEFLREGSAVTDFLYPDRIVVGANSPRATELLSQVYEPLTSGRYARSRAAVPRPDGAPIPAPLVLTSTRSAELIKHASNAFLAMKISFINAVAGLCESVGASVEEVCRGLGSDSRIGARFLRPGIGYGGSCLPKDLTAFRAVARECGYDFRLLEEVIRINQEQQRRFLRKVRSALWTLQGKRLAVLGLAFKGGTDDIRESPAIALAQQLLREGCRLAVFDPAAMERARPVLESPAVSFASSAYDAARDADALLILTDWEEFAALDLERLRAAMNYPIVIDGRNLYLPETMAAHGFHYFSVGRQDVSPEPAPLADLRKAG